MKSTFPLLVTALLATGSASGATILLTDVRPSQTTSTAATTSVIGTSNNGTLSTITTSNIRVYSDSDTAGSTLTSGTYGVQIAGITVGLDTGITLHFNLTLTASSTGGSSGMFIRRGAGRGWSVDTAPAGGSSTERLLNPGETITFSINTITLTGGDEPYNVVFDGFSDGLFIAETGTGTFTPGVTATMVANSGGSGYASNLDMGFTITPIPEPSLPAMAGICMAALLARRHRRERV